jgi:hypothetical protein
MKGEPRACLPFWAGKLRPLVGQLAYRLQPKMLLIERGAFQGIRNEYNHAM